MHEKVKRFSSLLSPQTRATSSGNGKAMIAMSGMTLFWCIMNCIVFEAILVKKMEYKLKWLKVTANGKHFR